MLLYHGSNIAVEKPRLFKTDRRVNFGSGFYLTSSFDQAKRWAQVVSKRRRERVPLVSVFSLDESQLGSLNVLEFDGASAEWLRFVGMNRRNEGGEEDYDLVIGPVANDNTMPTLRLFFAGIYSEEEAIGRLLPQKLRDQYAFKTQKALSALKYCEVREA